MHERSPLGESRNVREREKATGWNVRMYVCTYVHGRRCWVIYYYRNVVAGDLCTYLIQVFKRIFSKKPVSFSEKIFGKFPRKKYTHLLTFDNVLMPICRLGNNHTQLIIYMYVHLHINATNIHIYTCWLVKKWEFLITFFVTLYYIF